MGIDDEVFSIDGYYELDYATVKDVGVGKAVWLLQARPESRHNVGSFHIGLTEVKYDLDIRKATPEQLVELESYITLWIDEVEAHWAATGE
jgi:hypothetical protein